MHVSHFKVFADLVATGSYTLAADLNEITQSAVSQQVKALEFALASELIDRTGREFRLTLAGGIVHEAAKSISQDYRALAADFQAPKLKLQFETLRAFLAVHRANSFSDAGDSLGITQSAVSQQIKSLERLLSAKLFDRSNVYQKGKILPLTSAGIRFEPLAASIVREQDRLQRLLRVSDGETPNPEPTFEMLPASRMEGRAVFIAHLRRERSRSLVAAKKADFVAEHGRLFCEACRSDFASTYGDGASTVFEVHHRIMLGSADNNGVITSLKDLAIVCANCHQALHASAPPLSVEQLEGRIRQMHPTARTGEIETSLRSQGKLPSLGMTTLIAPYRNECFPVELSAHGPKSD